MLKATVQEALKLTKKSVQEHAKGIRDNAKKYGLPLKKKPKK